MVCLGYEVLWNVAHERALCGEGRCAACGEAYAFRNPEHVGVYSHCGPVEYH